MNREEEEVPRGQIFIFFSPLNKMSIFHNVNKMNDATQSIQDNFFFYQI